MSERCDYHLEGNRQCILSKGHPASHYWNNRDDRVFTQSEVDKLIADYRTLLGEIVNLYRGPKQSAEQFTERMFDFIIRAEALLAGYKWASQSAAVAEGQVLSLAAFKEAMNKAAQERGAENAFSFMDEYIGDLAKTPALLAAKERLVAEAWNDVLQVIREPLIEPGELHISGHLDVYRNVENAMRERNIPITPTNSGEEV